MPVLFENIWHFETIFKSNVYIVGLDQIPLLGGTCNIYNTLLYKSEKRGTTHQFWFLYEERDNGIGHFNAITNIKAFMGVPYFCTRCLGCFNHTSAIDNHQCWEYVDCTGCATKQQIIGYW